MALFDLDQHESTEWEPERPLADVLQAWMTPIKKRSRQSACVLLAAALLAPRVLLLLRDIERGEFPDDDGPWAGCGETPPELAEEHMHEFFDYDDDLGLDDFG